MKGVEMLPKRLRAVVGNQPTINQQEKKTPYKLREQINQTRQTTSEAFQKQVEEAVRHADAERRKQFVDELNERLQHHQNMLEDIRQQRDIEVSVQEETKPLKSLNQRFEKKHGSLSPEALMKQHISNERLLHEYLKSSRELSLKNKRATLLGDKGRFFSCDDAEKELQKNATHQHRRTFPL